MKIFLFLIVLFSGVVFPWRSVFADSGQGGLTLSPMFQEITLDRAERQKDFSISLTNNTDTLVTLRLSLLDFGSLDESGGVAFLGASRDLEKKYALASWMRPEKDVLTLMPGENQEVRVFIENRDSLSPGGHYGALVFKAGDDTIDPNKTNEVAINQLFSVLVFVKKVGGEIYQLNLKEQEFARNEFFVPEAVQLRFENSGNVHVVPRGTVTIMDPLGRMVSKGVINEESGIMLPETFRVYSTHLRTLAWSFVPGRYTLTIAYRYDGKEDFEIKSYQIFILPSLSAALVAVAVVLFGWYGIRRRKKVL